MRDITRIPIVMEKLQEVWEKMPEMRFGQLIYCITYKLGCNAGLESRLFNIEDDELLKAIQEFKDTHSYKDTSR